MISLMYKLMEMAFYMFTYYSFYFMNTTMHCDFFGKKALWNQHVCNTKICWIGIFFREFIYGTYMISA